MAGLPDSVITRARGILADLEDEEAGESRRDALRGFRPGGDETGRVAAAAGELFRPSDLVAGELSTIDPDDLAPREALELIYRWKRTLD